MLWHMSKVCSPISGHRLVMSNFSSLLIVFYRFFTWIALGDVDLRFSLMLARKANVVEEEIESRDCITNAINFYKCLCCMTVMSLSAGVLQMINAATRIYIYIYIYIKLR